MQEIGIPSNAITALPVLSWRGLDTPPYTMANVSGGHRLAKRAWPYVDGAGHEHTGREPLVMPAKFYFVNTVQRRLFPELFTEWVDAVVFDPTEDKLEYPLLGKLDARVQTWAVTAEATNTGGVIMDITWVETILDPEAQFEFAGVTASLHEAARKADEHMANLSIDFPTGERTTSLTDLVGQINGLVFSTRLTVEGAINQALGFVTKIFETVDAVQDFGKWALMDALGELYAGLKALGEPATKAVRPTAVLVLGQDESLDAVASTVGNTVGEIITLNPGLLGSPMIEKGTSVSYFA